MPEIPLTGHKLYDALWNRELLLRGLEPKLNPDGSISTETLSLLPAEARRCSKGEGCLFSHIVLQGGEPCEKCKYLTAGDYFIPGA